jgi:hypothetical protein
VKGTSSVAGACALGAGFGAATSLSNGFASPFEPDSFARIASVVLDAAWAWGGLAVVAGRLAAAPARGALAGAIALIAATTVYYGTDSIVRQEPLALYWSEMFRWWLASLIVGSALGGVGAYVGRPGLLGLFAGLTIPVVATVQMIVLPPGAGGPVVTPAMSWARLLVLVAAAVGAAAVIIRFLLAERRRRRDRNVPVIGSAISDGWMR